MIQADGFTSGWQHICLAYDFLLHFKIYHCIPALFLIYLRFMHCLLCIPTKSGTSFTALIIPCVCGHGAVHIGTYNLWICCNI